MCARPSRVLRLFHPSQTRIKNHQVANITTFFPIDLRRLFSASVATSTANLYSRHISNWIVFCRDKGANHSEPDSDLILAFLSKTVLAHGASSAQTCEAALRKFAVLNSIDPFCFHNPAIKCLMQGGGNLVPSAARRHHNHRLAFTMPALQITSTILMRKAWSDYDKHSMWALILTAF